jgi:hypothetical protein
MTLMPVAIAAALLLGPFFCSCLPEINAASAACPQET